MGKFNLILNDFCRKKNIELRERERVRRSIREARRVCPPPSCVAEKIFHTLKVNYQGVTVPFFYTK